MLLKIRWQDLFHIHHFLFLTAFLFTNFSGLGQTFNENWDSGKAIKKPWAEEGFKTTVSNDYSSSGRYSFKSELPADVHGNPRSEIRFEGKGAVSKFQDQGSVWQISFSLYVPSDFRPDPVKESILQLKDIMDPCDQAGGNPPFKIGLEKYDLSATMRWTDQRCASELGLKYFGNLLKVRPGKWHYFVLKVGWDHRKNGDGFFELYAKVGSPPAANDRVLNYRGPTGYNDNYGHYLKLGIYKWLWKVRENVNTSRSNGVNKRVLYYDDIEIRKGLAPTTSNQSPKANAGPDQTATLPISTLKLKGSATDPDNNINSYKWEQKTGPSTLTLKNENSLEVELGNLKEGVYLMRLTVRDEDGESDTDDVLVTVNAEKNQPPTVDAGRTVEITLPDDRITLKATGTDSDGTIESYNWKQASGPSDASLSGENTSDLTAANLVEGTYLFKVTVIDNEGAQAEDGIQVMVHPEATSAKAVNQAPNANAGADITVILPKQSVSLKGAGSDTDGTIEKYQWQQVSGPADATLSGTGSANLEVKDLIPGVFVFELTVKDDQGAIDNDQVQVMVQEAPPTTLAISANVTETTCNAEIGAIELLLEGGQGPFTYQWSTGARNKNLNNLAAGDYKVTVTDTDGNAVSKTFTVESVNANIKVEAVIKNATCADQNGAIKVEASGGTGPYNYEWSHGATGPTLDKLNIGIYQVTITNQQGCFMEAEYTVNQNPGPAKPAILQSADSLYITNQAQSYQWFKDDIAIDGANQSSLKFKEAGTYSVQISNANNCSASSDYFYAQDLPVTFETGSYTLHQMDVYPNPATREVNLRVIVNEPAMTSFAVYDSHGRIMQSEEMGMVNDSNVKTLSVDQYPQGVYIIRAKVNNEIVTKRFIKQ